MTKKFRKDGKPRVPKHKPGSRRMPSSPPPSRPGKLRNYTVNNGDNPTASKYDPKIAEAVCERLAAGETLTDICSTPGYPSATTVRRWAIKNIEGFWEQYDLACKIRADMLAEEIITIADSDNEEEEETEEGFDGEGDFHKTKRKPAHERRRQRIDARKWYTAKLYPHRFGERITQQHTGADGGPLVVQFIDDIPSPPSKT